MFVLYSRAVNVIYDWIYFFANQLKLFSLRSPRTTVCSSILKCAGERMLHSTGAQPHAPHLWLEMHRYKNPKKLSSSLEHRNQLDSQISSSGGFRMSMDRTPLQLVIPSESFVRRTQATSWIAKRKGINPLRFAVGR